MGRFMRAISDAANAFKSDVVRRDFWRWFGGVFKHWVGYVGCATVATFQILYGIWRREWPPAMSWLLLLLCFVFAAFISWRKEHEKSLSANRRATLHKVRDLIVETKNASGNNQYDSFGALLKYAEELRAEEDVDWVCDQLQTGGHDHPFWRLDLTCNYVLAGRRLAFLQEARASSLNITNATLAVVFAATQWSEKESYIAGREAYAESEKKNPIIVEGHTVSLLDPIEFKEPESPEKRRHDVTVKLSQFLRVGNSFLNGCRNQTEINNTDVTKWSDDARNLVWLVAGEVWEIRFGDISGIPPANPPLVVDERIRDFMAQYISVFNFVYPRCYRLRELIDAVEKGNVIPFSHPITSS